jgi:hypothetical protein
MSGCGGSDPLSNPSLTSTTGKFGQIEARQWNGYAPAEQAAYGAAFDLCNGWVDTRAATFDGTGMKASGYVQAHEDAHGVRDASADGCADGIAGLPLAGSGIPVPP